MAKKKSSKSSLPGERSAPFERASLPPDLQQRLQVVWSHVGHLVEWCNGPATWFQMFCAEARPYRETFYWEAVAEMVSNYVAGHPEASPEKALTDCLIATQCPPSADDSPRVAHFQQAWKGILDRSHSEIEAFKQADLELARNEGNYELVAGQYANVSPSWDREN